MRIVAIVLAINILATAGLVIDPNVATMLMAITATVGTVVAVIKWVESKIDHKVRNYAKLVNLRFLMTLQEISNLRELSGHPPLDMQKMREEVKESA